MSIRSTKCFVPFHAVALLALWGAGCQPRPLSVAEVERQSLSFVRDGITTREQILLQLGIPTSEFEGQRILTYRVGHDRSGLRVLTRERLVQNDGIQLQAYADGVYSLVLVFDDRHVLTKHSLVPLH